MPRPVNKPVYKESTYLMQDNAPKKQKFEEGPAVQDSDTPNKCWSCSLTCCGGCELSCYDSCDLEDVDD